MGWKGSIIRLEKILKTKQKTKILRKKNKKFFGFISPQEDRSGQYHDLCLVVFPSSDPKKKWVVCLAVGSLGFANDQTLAKHPGTRRKFSILTHKNGLIKSDFTDIERPLEGIKLALEEEDKSDVYEAFNSYQKVVLAAEVFDPKKGEGEETVTDPENEEKKDKVYVIKIFDEFLATYAKMRDWRSNQVHDKEIDEAIKKITDHGLTNEPEIDKIKNLLEKRKFIVLQGAPGVGKTYIAKKIAEEKKEKEKKYETFFTQFHAETTYSDFIYGIRPGLEEKNVNYKEHMGIFIEAFEKAKNETSEKKVLLIIDEINRANLSNVLGPIFYLFEYQRKEKDSENDGFDGIELYPGKKVHNLPDNFYVIATMNTADRSLAVVDFALRRRFAWYTLKPRVLTKKDLKTKTSDGMTFYKEYFDRIADIFYEYASHDELNLQPGHSYFIVPEGDNEDEAMKDRLRYELLPLIREYVAEGLLLDAVNEFNVFFMKEIQTPLFE